MLQHGVAHVRVGCVDNVWITCNWRDQDECARAQARSQVYMAGKAWWNVRGARGDLQTADEMVSSCARDSEWNLTCKVRAAWAGSTGLRQERFQASCYDTLTS